MDSLVLVLLGSNLGNRGKHLADAQKQLQKIFGKPVMMSSIYSSSPWGNTEQPYYLNQVIAYNTSLSPRDVLDILLATEHNLGRDRSGVLWEPRTIDIDLLYHNGTILHEEGLTIPHPGIENRRFTLVPLVEICPEMIHPVLKLTHRQLLNQCKDQGTVTKMEAVS